MRTSWLSPWHQHPDDDLATEEERKERVDEREGPLPALELLAADEAGGEGAELMADHVPRDLQLESHPDDVET